MQEGRFIASLHIHAKSAIGCLKNFTILKGVFSLKMAHLVNQIISLCAMLTNFFLPLSKVLSSTNGVHDELCPYNHEEADTRMLLHGVHTARHGQTKVFFENRGN